MLQLNLALTKQVIYSWRNLSRVESGLNLFVNQPVVLAC